MDRLTFEGLFCDIAPCRETPGGSFCEDGMCSQRETWERLKAYEDTGLTPVEVDFANEAAQQLEGLCKLCDLDRLEELVQADKDGRVLVLPCKVGDLELLIPAIITAIRFLPLPLAGSAGGARWNLARNGLRDGADNG